MNKNQQRLVEAIVNHESIASDVLVYIKEHYNVDGEYIQESGEIKLTSGTPASIALAKEFISEHIGEDLYQVTI